MTTRAVNPRQTAAQSWAILPGDCRSSLATLDPESVQACVTSPPYYALRDYGNDGQIGLEATADLYVAALVDVFRSVRRVLRADGTVWLNLGDSYAMRAQGQSQTTGSHDGALGRGERPSPRRRMSGDLKNKDLIGIPWMVAFALRADGWYLRSDIIWAKPNPMPESVTDRPTRSHEHIFLMSKAARYHYDHDAIREEAIGQNVHDLTGPARSGVPGQADHRGSRPQTRRAHELAAEHGLTDAHIEAIRACGVADAGKAQTTQDGYGKNDPKVQALADEAKAALTRAGRR